MARESDYTSGLSDVVSHLDRRSVSEIVQPIDFSPYEGQVVRIFRPGIGESSRAMTIIEDRYRMLLGASAVLADQPTVKCFQIARRRSLCAE